MAVFGNPSRSRLPDSSDDELSITPRSLRVKDLSPALNVPPCLAMSVTPMARVDGDVELREVLLRVARVVVAVQVDDQRALLPLGSRGRPDAALDRDHARVRVRRRLAVPVAHAPGAAVVEVEPRLEQ